jgi:hypothetical protein
MARQCPRCNAANGYGAAACIRCQGPLPVPPYVPGAFPAIPDEQPIRPYLPPASAPLAGERSAIPQVMGILMMVFAGLGVVAAFFTLGLHGWFSFMNGAAATFARWWMLSTVLGLGISIMQLFAGLSAVLYRSAAPRLAAMYGWSSIVFTVGTLILTAITMPSFVTGHLARGFSVSMNPFAIGILGLTWPIIVLALMSRPAARAACRSRA